MPQTATSILGECHRQVCGPCSIPFVRRWVLTNNLITDFCLRTQRHVKPGNFYEASDSARIPPLGWTWAFSDLEFEPHFSWPEGICSSKFSWEPTLTKGVSRPNEGGSRESVKTHPRHLNLWSFLLAEYRQATEISLRCSEIHFSFSAVVIVAV